MEEEKINLWGSHRKQNNKKKEIRNKRKDKKVKRPVQNVHPASNKISEKEKTETKKYI